MKILFSKVIIGAPQIFALLLLGVFAAQCGWVIQHLPLSAAERDHIWSGRQQLEYGAIPRKFDYTPLVNITAAAPLKMDVRRDSASIPTPENVRSEVRRLQWIMRLPFLLGGLLLGGSLWYVARRLYGNAGGYTALALYCSSPAMVLRFSRINEAGFSAWGVFGIVFTAIAISHNLYAPRKKWRYRTLLLIVASTIAIASHPAAMLLSLVAFAFMLYLAPGRRLAASGVMVFSTLGAMALVFAAYSFIPRAWLNGIDLREWMTYGPKQAQALFLDRRSFLERFSPATLTLLVTSVLIYFSWKRTRYFGNTAPLLVGGILLYWALLTPMAQTASIWALPFFFVFTGGVWADLLETRFRRWIMVALVLLLAENAVFGWTALRGFA